MTLGNILVVQTHKHISTANSQTINHMNMNAFVPISFFMNVTIVCYVMLYVTLS